MQRHYPYISLSKVVELDILCNTEYLNRNVAEIIHCACTHKWGNWSIPLSKKQHNFGTGS